MRVVIKPGQETRYTITGYNYKALQSSLPDLPPVSEGWKRATFKNLDDIPTGKEHIKAPQAVSIEEEPQKQEDQSELIESLLKKADDFSSKYLKAQMDLEDLQEKFQSQEAMIQKKAYEEGFNTAKEETKQQTQKEQDELFEILKKSVTRMNDESELFHTALASIQEELVGAALDIAKEVILKELHIDAKNIALHLAKNLMAEIDKESKITLKVHPTHVQFFKESLGQSERIRITEDHAVKEGGVIVVSNMGTIEADIMSRYEQVKRNVHNV